MKTIVACPISEGAYAGWYKAIRGLSGKLSNEVKLKFFFARNIDKFPHLLFSIFFAIQFSIYVLKNQSKINNILFPMFFMPNVLASMLIPATKINFFVRISGDELKSSHSLSFFLRKLMLRKASKVVLLNANDLNKIIALGISADKCLLIPNGTSRAFFSSAKILKEESRIWLNIDSNCLVIGNVGSLCHRKHQHLIIESLSRLKVKKDVVVLLVGPNNGSLESDIKYAEYCENLASINGIKLILTGEISNTKKALSAMDIFVFPSLSEGMPNALLEAVAMDLPCIASNIPGNSDIAKFSKKLNLFSTGSVDELTVAIGKILPTLPLKERTSDETILLKSHFSHGAMAYAYNKLFLH